VGNLVLLTVLLGYFVFERKTVEMYYVFCTLCLRKFVKLKRIKIDCIKNGRYYLGVTLRKKLRVGLSVPAFFLFNCQRFKPLAIEKKKELHCNPSREPNVIKLRVSY
jgi:hypothetical protein